MKTKLLLLLFVSLSLHKSYSQSTKKIRIDTLANRIEVLETFYRCEINKTYFDKDSNLIGYTSLSYRFADKKGRDLVRVDEWNKTIKDSSMVFYYFQNRKLIKVDTRTRVKGQLFYQEFYFENGKLIYASSIEKPLFVPKDYLRRATQYLKNHCKEIQPNYII